MTGFTNLFRERLKLSFVDIVVAGEALKFFFPFKQPRAFRFHGSRDVACSTRCSNMGANEFESRFLMVGDRVDRRDKCLHGVAAFALPLITSMDKLVRMGVGVAIGTIRESRDRKCANSVLSPFCRFCVTLFALH
jgi:hypothetical protein